MWLKIIFICFHIHTVTGYCICILPWVDLRPTFSNKWCGDCRCRRFDFNSNLHTVAHHIRKPVQPSHHHGFETRQCHWSPRSFVSVIPQSCRFKGLKYECGLSISCVLGGGRPLDLCSGGMIWACCIDRDPPNQYPANSQESGLLSNASKYLLIWIIIIRSSTQIT